MKQGELAWVQFTYSDQSQRKIRPVVVVSNDRYNTKSEDLVVCALTSNTQRDEYAVFVEQKDLENGTLSMPSKIKTDKIAQIHKSLAIKSFGKINTKKFDQVTMELNKLFSRKRNGG